MSSYSFFKLLINESYALKTANSSSASPVNTQSQFFNDDNISLTVIDLYLFFKNNSSIPLPKLSRILFSSMIGEAVSIFKLNSR